MKLKSMLTILILLMVAACSAELYANDGERIVFSGGTLIDGNGSVPIDNAMVIVEGDRILFAGSAEEVVIPPKSRIIDTTGLTILPGFFNAHAHFTNRKDFLRAWAQGGVTTIRDISFPMSELVRHIDDYPDFDDPYLARIICGGPAIDVPGSRQVGNYYGIIINSIEEAHTTTERIIDAGAKVVKVYMEDGSILGAHWNVMSLEELQMIVRTAHGRGVPVAAHVQEAYLVEKALDGGLDDVAHSQLDDYLSQEIIERMVREDVYLVPTLEMYRNSATFIHYAKENLRRLVNAGGKIALGTDFDNQNSAELGMPLIEMQLMQQAGMTPMQIIVAGTKHSAHVCGLEDELGTIVRGKIADIILVRGNPLVDLALLKNEVVMVMHGGVIIRNELE